MRVPRHASCYSAFQQIMTKFLTTTALCMGFALAANAIPVEIPGPGQDMAKNGTGIAGGNANDDANNFFRLQTVINAWDLANPGNLLPTPLSSNPQDLGSPVVGANGLLGFDYAVLHYGAGTGGTKG